VAEAPGSTPAVTVGAGPAASRRREPGPRFVTTNRWLRGRILAQARDAADETWVTYSEPIGSHGTRAVRDVDEARAMTFDDAIPRGRGSRIESQCAHVSLQA
jgi:hypothetical protein